MASGLAGVCSYAVCSFVFLLLVSTVDSRKNADFHVEYLVGRQSSNIQYTIRSLPDDSLHRYRRQVVSSPADNSSTSSSNTADETAVTHATRNSSTPSLTSPSTASATTNINTTTSPTTSTTATNTTTTAKVTTTTTLKTSTTTSSKESTTTTPQVTIKKDNHNYYISVIRPDSSKLYFTELLSPTTQETLSSGHRVAVTVALPFKFRFYGHIISNITVATGGFIYTSPFLHQWLTATQYIAPLMANFDTSTTEDSEVLYKQVGNEFIVEWRNVLLRDQNNTGAFIFQAKLKNDGTITFVYLKLPVPVANISTINHPVKIGLSDAFYNDTFIPQYGIKRRTIYEYHRVSFMPEQIEEGTVIILEPLPTCNTIEDCKTCTEHVNVNFDCKWCEKVSRCSDGLDWNRQNWIEQGCTNLALIQSSWCGDLERTSSATTASASSPNIQTGTHTLGDLERTSPATNQTQSSKCDKEKSTNVAAIVAVVLILVLLFGGVGFWVLYAYTHPTSSSGIWLMEHRPSQMKARISNMKFWKRSTPNGTKYQVETEA
ncbi:plexin domain-containing protein 2-like isoform X2 [Pomacea canaliculata]|uniref:plexin domain-containing protein 2-like isoform X2 n=1 Tax=Pomacea canaliculata TaxID=400727 RepID=UPI000D72955C|nr:plexin domain-containing protein 2-like isoform X2 [Pomacea canaliculata]